MPPTMALSFAAVIYRPADVPEPALAQGFAVALGGWDVPAPRLLVAELPGLPGWSAAFYASGARVPRGAEDEEFEHACELFEDELPPALGVHDAAVERAPAHAPERAAGPVIYALTYAEDLLHDDAWRFDARGVERRFVHEGDDGVEVGFETPEAGESRPLEVHLPPGAGEDEEPRALAAAARPHRGSEFLSSELGAPILPALMGALFAADRRITVRLIDPDTASIEDEVRRLNRALRRVDGRGAPASLPPVAGVPAPAACEAFARTYDWADPADPQDLYRELAIGAVEGTLRFLRPGELDALGADATWRKATEAGCYPVARLSGSALGGAAAKGLLALAGDAERLALVKPDGNLAEAGPTFGELLRYLSLGWTRRSDAEEDMIGALMLRARLRVEKG